MENKKNKKWGNIINVLLIVFAGLMLFVPSAKALVLTALINIGILSPKQPVEQPLVLSEAITYRNSKGQNFNLESQKGKVIFINFWATWCPPCIAEMPYIQKLYDQFKTNENVVFITIDADDKLRKAENFLAKRKMDLPVYNITSSIPDYIFDGTLPTTIVIDKQNRIVYRGTGAADYSNKKFVSMMQKLASE